MATPPPPQPSPSASPSAVPHPSNSGPSSPKLPSPSPGTSPDPNYEPPPPPPTGADGRPSDARRKWEREQLKQAAPGSDGKGFHIEPGHVYYTSALVRDEQFTFHKAARHLVEDVNHRQAAGKGSGPDDFVKAYDEVAKLFLEVWAKAVASIGGVAVGLTLTANNYVAADWASRGVYGPPPRRDPPIGVGNVSYGPVASIKWTGTGDGTDIPIVGAIGEVPDFLADLIKPAIEEGLRLGKTAEITPGAETDDLRSIGNAWEAAGKAAQKSAESFTGCMAYLTDSGNSEWQGAMNAFCQSIWGTTAWGRSWKPDGGFMGPQDTGGRDWRTNPSMAPSARRPIIEVLKKTGDEMKTAFHDVATAAETCRKITEHLGIEAAKATVKDLTPDGFSWEDFTKMAAIATFGKVVVVFRSHMDKSGADKAVDDYNKAFHEGAEKLRALIPELNEAALSAPTYVAEEARAEAFGARSLNDFKNEHKWSTPGDADHGVYKVDLASTEWMQNSHTVTKHVGLTDEQLAQRLRDELKKPPRPGTDWPYGQPQVGEASTFADLDSAQKMTQYNIDQNSKQISEWIAEQKENDPGKRKRLDISVPNTPYGDSGRSISKAELKSDPFPADKARPVQGVETRLVYNEDLDPPFTVMTSMPKDL